MAKKDYSRPSFLDLTAQMRQMVGDFGERLERRKGRKGRDKDCLACLKNSLQLAIDLEFSTIPPYLTALWSIEDDLHPAAKSIREVVQEEMLHMAMACNMLTAIGGQPQITWDGFPEEAGHPPGYPSHLPGGLHPDLEVPLTGLSDEALLAFMRIELPVKVFPLSDQDDWHADRRKKVESIEVDNQAEHDDSCTTTDSGETQDEKSGGTIGAFYAALLEAFKSLAPRFEQDSQITGPLAYSNVGSLDSVEWVIELISHQGEGSTRSPFESEKRRDLAHFYRFEEVYMEAELKWSPVSRVFRKGKELPRPRSAPMGPIRKGGYTKDDLNGLSPAKKKLVKTNLKKFDIVYSHLLRLLQQTWSGGGQRTLVEAYETMFELEEYAKPLMKVEIPGKNGLTFGPCFRYRAKS